MQNVDKPEGRELFLQSASASNFRFNFFSFVLNIMFHVRALSKVASCPLINWQQSRDVWKFTYFSRSYEYLLRFFFSFSFLSKKLWTTVFSSYFIH